MSCERYKAKNTRIEVGRTLENPEKKVENYIFEDDRELLKYLMAQERMSEIGESVNLDSYTSD